MHHPIEQNTDEWLQLRSGHLTGSSIAKIMANGEKAFGDPAKKLAVDIALEQIVGHPVGISYSNAQMERGHEQEPIARLLYESEYFYSVDDGGVYDNGFTGCSPDGLVNLDGLIEIKSVIAAQQYKRVKSGTYDSGYRWQLMFNLKESGREWIDYISYCADFPDGKQLFVQRIHAKDQIETFRKIDVRVEKYLKLVEQVKADINAAR